MTENLQAQIERITFSSEETGYTVARAKIPGRRDLVTVVGPLLSPVPGEVLMLTGQWKQHPRYGEQFEVESFHSRVPATVAGIRRYLGSGLIKGIGPVMAARIVRKFKDQTLDVIEKSAERLQQVEGIGAKRAEMIRNAWADQAQIRELMLFLQNHGVSANYAAKIFKQYGPQAVSILQQNPYRLAMEVYGIGFVTADAIADQLGFEKDHPLRAQAGVIYVLSKLADDGHVYYPQDALIEAAQDILSVSKPVVEQAIAALVVQDYLVAAPARASAGQAVPTAIYLKQFHVCETGIARSLSMLAQFQRTDLHLNADRALQWVQQKLSIQLAERQQRAVAAAVTDKVLVITGGPGTGKTTIIQAVMRIYRRKGLKVLLAAPTGRAAKRLGESAGHEARTIHRMLAFSPKKGGFEHNEDNLLVADLLVVDEASMIDVVLMYHLLKAVPPRATLILVGDVNQLPSVGAGNVLKDVIASKVVAVVELNEIFRQARHSRIIVNAHRILGGKNPAWNNEATDSDFFFIQKEDPQDALQVILELTARRIPKKFGFDPMEQIQVLTPMHRGLLGSGNLNSALQEALNPGPPAVQRAGNSFRTGDKVMQVRNNYDKDVFNGDIGRILSVDAEQQNVTVAMDDRAVVYDFADLDELTPAYAISVHKAQGSEYPAVVMPVMTQHYILLQRNLIYTGVTRGRKLVVLVGTRKAMAMAVRNDRTAHRFSLLDERLRQCRTAPADAAERKGP